MGYPTMCCEVESVEKTECEKVPMKDQLEGLQTTLYETQAILTAIIVNITNDRAPDRDLPQVNCMSEQATVNYNLSCDCREMAMRIKRLLFGDR